ncbi:hypothetical protein BOC43_03375 [Burkholderia pseudomallei]|nr:hypothetical protein BOC43_03375 [Burkholderia pseudomallei]
MTSDHERSRAIVSDHIRADAPDDAASHAAMAGAGMRGAERGERWRFVTNGGDSSAGRRSTARGVR